jgi:predicted AlkP superfamily pyrophosphatase or phosphodiesterase
MTDSHVNTRYLVLSPGRTGSQLVAKLLYSKQNLDNGTLFDMPDASFLSKNFSVGHSHFLYDKQHVIEKFNVILSYRESFEDTVLSRMIANKFEIWKPGNEKTKVPFTIDCENLLPIIHMKQQWYEHYVNFVELDTIGVISYEVMMDLYVDTNWHIDNKKTLINNYDQAREFITSQISPKLKSNIDSFINCKIKRAKQAAYRLII